MPRTKTFLTPAEYAVLGLVRERPAYGYELQRHLTGKRGLGRVCPVEPAMVYAILKSLSGLELIDGEWDSSTYPPKAIYRITDNGYAAFERWLRSPVGRMREVRLDFLIKLYFALKNDLELARELLATQIEVTSDYAEEIAGERAQLGEGLQSFDAIVLESKASAARITREWLEKCLEDLSPSYASKRGR
jgi:PadR family transcriptional regulator, regulatory protein AphA